MSNRSQVLSRAFSSALLIVAAFSSLSHAVTADRISGALTAGQSVALRGNVRRQALPQFDRGPADPALRFGSIMLLTTPTTSQLKDLTRLVAEQQNRKSPNYHKWLTPEQWADRFGLSRNDIKQLTAWLKGQGFSGIYVARGRNWIRFSGTAAQVQKAFGTEIHHFNVNGEMHVANATSPKIPRALAGIVTEVRGMDDFFLKPMSHPRARPYYTDGTAGYPELIAPGDIATMYDINALYTAGIDGTGQTMAVIGQTDVFQADLVDFRTGFGLSSITCTTSTTTADLITACTDAHFQYVLVGTDPGTPTSNVDLNEADLDIEWAGATARNAQIIYVNAPLISGATTSGGVDVAWHAAVDSNVAPVISLSYGDCEFFYPASVAGSADETELMKANTLGITFVSASGDGGAAACDNQDTTVTGNLAQGGTAVTYPASSPEVTAVGGTSIDVSNLPLGASLPTTYWNNASGTDGGSMIIPIPEIAWNDDTEWPVFCASDATNFCTTNSITSAQAAQAVPQIGLSASGGGVSNCATQINGNTACGSGFSQPAWQYALTISGQTSGALGFRFVPDVALLASPNFPGYIYCTQLSVLGDTGTGSACDPLGGAPATGITNALALGNSPIGGGTSVATPVFAGMVVLLNQYLAAASPGLGNINPMLYSLGATPAAPPNNVFNPVNSGTNEVYCTVGTGQFACPGTGIIGFNSATSDATTGYNLVTGLGSVDLNNLALAWAAARPVPTLTISSSATQIGQGQSVTFTATLSATAALGNVVFLDNGTAIGTVALTSSSAGVATFATTSLPVGADSVTASYSGDGYNGPATTTTAASVTVAAPSFTLTPPSAPVSVTPGSAVDVTIPVVFNGGFTGTVTFTCTEPASLTESTCTAPAAATAAGNYTFHITTMAATSASNLGSDRSLRIFYAALLPGLFGIMLTAGSRKRSRRGLQMLGLIVVLGISTMWLGSCGGSSSTTKTTNPGTPAGNYTVTVAGTSAGVTVSKTFTLAVQ